MPHASPREGVVLAGVGIGLLLCGSYAPVGSLVEMLCVGEGAIGTAPGGLAPPVESRLETATPSGLHHGPRALSFRAPSLPPTALRIAA